MGPYRHTIPLFYSLSFRLPTKKTPPVGLEPTTLRLKAARSTDWARKALTILTISPHTILVYIIHYTHTYPIIYSHTIHIYRYIPYTYPHTHLHTYTLLFILCQCHRLHVHTHNILWCICACSIFLYTPCLVFCSSTFFPLVSVLSLIPILYPLPLAVSYFIWQRGRVV